MEALEEKLRAYAASDMLPMHMPGHKRRAAAFPWLEALGGGMDITEIAGFDDLNDPRELFRELERRAAELWGAEESICLVNGSTAGVLTAVRAALERGGELLMARGCHRSVYHAAELTGAALHYLTPRTDRELGAWCSVTAEETASALDAHPGVKLAVITSPTYEGVISDVRAIAGVCHRRGVTLLVDEAHGAHLGFGGFPAGAVRCGADLVVQSLHKTLPSLTQTAVLHVNGPLADRPAVRRNAAIFQTSSPSYLLSASIDGCVRFLEREGDAAADRWLEALERFRERTRDLANLRLWRGGAGVFSRDPSKLVISAAGADTDGPKLMALLRDEFHIELEMAAGRYALAMTGMGDTAETLGRLAEALRAADGLCGPGPVRDPCPDFSLPDRRMTVREALDMPGRFYDLPQAMGRVCGEYVWSYPPGAPILVPGEVIDEAAAGVISAAVNVRSTRGGAPNRIFCAGEY